VSATLRLERRTSPLMELRRASFGIYLDRQQIGSIDSRNSVELPIEPGPHLLQLRVGRASSADRSFDAPDGTTVRFRCSGARIWPIYLASLLKPDLGIVLRRE
jgi:hypothetical protein